MVEPGLNPDVDSGFSHNTDSEVKSGLKENDRGDMESSRDAKEGISVLFRDGVRMRLGECLGKVSETGGLANSSRMAIMEFSGKEDRNLQNL